MLGASRVEAGMLLRVNEKHVELRIDADCHVRRRREESPVDGISHRNYPEVAGDREVVRLNPCKGFRRGVDEDVVLL